MDKNNVTNLAKKIKELLDNGEYTPINIGLNSNKNSNTMESILETEYFEDLLVKNKIGQIFTDLLPALKEVNQDDLYDDVLLLNSRFNRNEDKFRKNTISNSEYNLELNKIINSLKDYLRDYQPNKNKKNNSIQFRTVFLSYNHKDRLIAENIKNRLEQSGISVTFDIVNLEPGEDIKNFIEKSIKQSDATLSLVSINSLLSSWVSMETINTLNAQKITDKRFLAAFIDDSFFKRDFVDNAMDKIEEEINGIKEIIRFRLEKNRNINDLNNELERYNDLLHSLPKIIQRLKESLAIDVAGDNFEAGVEKIIQSLKS